MKIGYAKTLTGKLDSVTQETFIDQYAVEKFYVDKISSTSLDAPRLTDMLKSVREGDTVIVNAFSEVAYNVRVFLKIVEQLELKKVTFISIRENLDTSTSIGKFAVSILTELKQIEHENLLERQRIGIEQANLFFLLKYSHKKGDGVYEDFSNYKHYRNIFFTSHSRSLCNADCSYYPGTFEILKIKRSPR